MALTAETRARGGRRAGAGRKKDEFKAAFDAAAQKLVTPAQMEALVRSLVERALAGDTRAAALLFDRLLGKVESRVQVGGDADGPQRVVVVFDEEALTGRPEVSDHERF